MQMDKNQSTSVGQRLAALFDEGAYKEIGSRVMEKNVPAAVVTAYGYVNGNPVCAFAQDQSIENGAVGMAQAEKIAKLFALAAKTGAPVVGIYDSNGAYMDGSADSLNAYSAMISQTAALSGVVPQISVVAGPCGGCAAMMASAADIVIMTKDAELFIAPGTGSAQEMAAKGTAALVEEDDTAAIAQARALVNLLPVNNLAGVPCMEYAMPDIAENSLLSEIIDGGSLMELYTNWGNASCTALATVEGSTVGIAAAGKNGEKITGADCRKLARFMRTCDAFSIPVVTFVDTEGFESESDCAAAALTRLAGVYAEATTPKLAVITGNAVGPVFVALAGKGCSADFTFALEDAAIAPMAPESAVEFLWHDRLKGAADLKKARADLAKEYTKTIASAVAAAERGTVDEVVAAGELRSVLTEALRMLEGKRVTNLPRKHNNFPL